MLSVNEPPGLSIHRQMKLTSCVANLVFDHALDARDQLRR